MSMLELAFSTGQLAALMRPKLAWLSATHPVVQESALLKSQPAAAAPPVPRPPSTPETLRETFDRHEQGETRVEPRRKLSAEALCTTCRKARHYGHCKRPIAIKKSDFNLGMTSDTSTDDPSTSPHYHSATSADSALARARDARPADEQAATAFADLFRHLGITSQTDEPGRMYGGLNKVSKFMIRKAPSIDGPDASDAVTRAFSHVDNAADSTCIDGSSAPSPGPAV